MSYVTLSQTALILFREGAEALLIIAALASYLTRVNAPEKTRVLYIGGGAGIIASIILAYVFATYFDGNHNDVLEGATLVVAALIMLYVSGWLFSKRDGAAWQGYLRGQVDLALKRSTNLISLGLVAFLAVFREGAETVLFLQAVANGENGWSFSFVLGLVVGFGALTVLFLIVRTMAVRLPLKPFFTFTAVFLFYMAVNFLGQSAQAFQELGWWGFTNDNLPQWLINIGASPSWEGFAMQLIVICLVPVVLRLPAMRPTASISRS
ncbi:FTR1 family iron permease [Varunaivibrio sulfuroxidans]|uniref:High-affinity iron transporter n=1 Tax=Varunaivibrio sulfuroxidans TaxID=1773489 RepID=A0A4R3JAL8_9PROT|nr:FTR1 family protein [Varunaivibrio sulfuroxidans]TCS62116.1 high-affinity iron transporter [Varunaivibrio sulfuroxidans]WES30549.1 FTR1 family protein [Varunaivibrio sulfuroxidans]